MKGDFLHFEHQNFNIWGFNIDLIRQPFLRLFGAPKRVDTGAADAEQMHSARKLERFMSTVTKVFIDCPRQAPDTAEGVEQNGDDEGQDQT